MDDGRKIAPEKKQDQAGSLVESSKALFLREIIEEFRNEGKHYDLDWEFAKTKQNRNLFVAAIVLGIVLVFTVGAIVITYYIQEQSKNITVDIQEFEDIHLQELLDSAKKAENKHKAALRDLENLQREQSMELQSIEDNLQRQLSIVENGTDELAIKRRKAYVLRAEANAEIALINEKYTPLVLEKEAEIAEYQQELDEYNLEQMEQARRQEEERNNQQLLFDIEMEKLTEYYEEKIAGMTNQYNGIIAGLQEYNKTITATLKTTHANEIAALIQKYNPTFTGEEIEAILNSPIDEQAFELKAPGEFRPILGSERVLPEEEYSKLTAASDSFNTIMSLIKEIPSENSIPLAILQLEYLHKQSLNVYESIWNTLADKVLARNAEIEQFRHALEFLISTQRENGYILDARDSESIVVYVNQFLDVEDGTQGFVFRDDNELIARIQFTVDDTGVKASLLELENEATGLKPYDKILIEVQ